MRKRLTFLYGMIFIASHRLVFLRLDIYNLIILQNFTLTEVIIFYDLIIINAKYLSQFINILSFFGVYKLNAVVLTNITLIRGLTDNFRISYLIWCINNIIIDFWILAFIFCFLTFVFSLFTYIFAED